MALRTRNAAATEDKSAKKPPIARATLKRVFTTFGAYRPHLFGILILVLASAALGLLSPFYLRTLIDEGLQKSNFSIITHYSLLTLAATLGATILGLGFGFLSLWVGQQIMRDLRNRLNEHLQGMSLRFFTRTRTGEIQSRLVNDVGGVAKRARQYRRRCFIKHCHRFVHARRHDLHGLAADAAQRGHAALFRFHRGARWRIFARFAHHFARTIGRFELYNAGNAFGFRRFIDQNQRAPRSGHRPFSRAKTMRSPAHKFAWRW